MKTNIFLKFSYYCFIVDGLVIYTIPFNIRCYEKELIFLTVLLAMMAINGLLLRCGSLISWGFLKSIVGENI